MLDLILILSGLFAACLVTELYSAAAAPLGYQEDGIRVGSGRSRTEDSSDVNPS